jgi:hypothetical protein
VNIPSLGLGEGLAHLFDLVDRTFGPEVDGRPHAHGAEVEGLLDRGEHLLVVGVGVAQEVVVVELHDEGDSVDIAPRDDAEAPDRRRHRVAVARQRQLDNIGRVEVLGVRSEARRRRVLDALVDRQDRDVARSAETAMVIQGA